MGIFVSFLTVICHSICAQKLSPQATISVLTCDPGNEIHSVFGHTSIWVSDPVRGIDEVYNYGMFSYEESNFLLNFLKGKMRYSLGRETIAGFMYTYRSRKRGVRAQTLNLDSLNKEKYYHFLTTNYLPENRKYWYDYFFDNCSSRVGVSLEAELTGYAYTDTTIAQKSFRQYLDEYMPNLPWTDFGIDLIQGQPADRVTTFREAMFLPDYLEKHLDRATFVSDGNVVPLVSGRRNLISFSEASSTSWFTPFVLFVFLLLFEILVFFFKDKFPKATKVYDIFWFVLVAVVSLIMLGMWFLTGHTACAQNWNLLWASPLYIPLLIFWKNIKVRKALLVLLAITTAIGLLGWSWLIPQVFHIAIIPISLILLIKVFRGWLSKV